MDNHFLNQDTLFKVLSGKESEIQSAILQAVASAGQA